MCSPDGGEAPETLQQVAVPLLSKEECQELYTQIVEEDIYVSYGLDYTTAITDNMVCAGYPEGGRGACHVCIPKKNTFSAEENNNPELC